MIIDVNGSKKKTNQLGHDVFAFQFMNNGKLMPMGVKGTEFLDEEYCSATSTSNRNGFGCTNKALTESEYWKNLP